MMSLRLQTNSTFLACKNDERFPFYGKYMSLSQNPRKQPNMAKTGDRKTRENL
jgi:hypothetical protein